MRWILWAVSARERARRAELLGVYLREALGQRAPDGQTAVAQVGAVIADALAASGCRQG